MICFGTIKVKNGKLLNLEYHQKRIDYTREFFGFTKQLDLKKYDFDLAKHGQYRLRIDYDEEIKGFTCKAFTCREFTKFRVVESDIKYDYKYTNRDKLDALKTDETEIIIVKDGYIRDTTVANIALYINGYWLTPKKPLLKGTTRARLIDDGFLKCANLTIEDLKKAENFAIMNALIDFKIIQKAEIELGFECTIQK